MSKPSTLLNELIEVARDGEQLYRDALCKSTNVGLKDWFRELGGLRRQLIDELSAHVVLLGEVPSQNRTLLGTSGKLYTEFLAALNSDRQVVYIDHLENAEDRLLARYRKALRETDSEALREVLERHLLSVQGAHERMRVLKQLIHTEGASLAADSIVVPASADSFARVEDVRVQALELIDANESVQNAARIMAERGVGFLPVCEKDRVIGVVTDRDLVVRVIADGRASASTPVSEAMTPDRRDGPGNQGRAHAAGTRNSL